MNPYFLWGAIALVLIVIHSLLKSLRMFATAAVMRAQADYAKAGLEVQMFGSELVGTETQE